ncbi:unnamed protein product [Dracunculus medinensis]|uniref:Cytoplasmic tRNA 2-thiolation protein 2 n=1 Tax=Dracunculus medinensis TaxID=318479 RepID=A0A0N4U6E6_DRAME|nr:unnamed protein product [Dracunculus medinensis]
MNCVKCNDKGTLAGLDVTKVYCKNCFIKMVKQKFSSAIGKHRFYKVFPKNVLRNLIIFFLWDGARKETLIVYDGNAASAFLLSLINENLKADTHKKAHLIPTIMVLLTVTDSKSLNSVIDRINHFKKIIDCRWIFCHIASLFRPITIFNEDDCSVFGEDSVMKWKELLDSCSSESIRIEFLRMCRILLCIRVADCLGIDKVMLADSSDFVVNCTLSSLAFGRGPAVHNTANIVDKSFTGISIIRPLRDISNKEIALLNRFEKNDELLIILNNDVGKNSLQSCTDDFVQDLCRQVIFRSNFLSVFRFCYGCSAVLKGVKNVEMLDEIFCSVIHSTNCTLVLKMGRAVVGDRPELYSLRFSSSS